MTTNVIDAIREKEADAHAEREEAFAERNRLNQAFLTGSLSHTRKYSGCSGKTWRKTMATNVTEKDKTLNDVIEWCGEQVSGIEKRFPRRRTRISSTANDAHCWPSRRIAE